ncbi:MAG: DinB family protein [Candidatus Acidiferrales bacterium]
MDHKEFFIKYWEKEAPATRKVIGRIPEDRCEYRADPKARTAREIAWLIVREEAALVDGLEKGAINWTEIPPPGKLAEIVSQYNHQHDSFTSRLKAIPPKRWEDQLPFQLDGKEFMKDIAYDMAWGFLMDQVHHRGQLSTYLRPMGAKVPSIYGPSADES